jgi:GTPase SAR1 family protein
MAGKRPAMGETAKIGTLYNSKNDSFLPCSIFNQELPVHSITTKQIHRKSTKIIYTDSYQDKLKQMEVENEFGVSILCGLVDPRGSGVYLRKRSDNRQCLHGALHHKIASVHEKLHFKSEGLENCVDLTTLGEATHVVTEIEWGVQSVMAVRQRVLDTIQASTIEEKFRVNLEKFEAAVRSSNPRTVPDEPEQNGDQMMDLEVTMYSDMMENEGIIFSKFREAYGFLDLVPKYINNSNADKGIPTSYTLVPIKMFVMFLGLGMKENISYEPPSSECMKQFIQLFDEFRTSKLTLGDYESFALMHQPYMSEDHLKTVAFAVETLSSAEDGLRLACGRLLQDVRGGTADSEVLWKLFQEFKEGQFSTQAISKVTEVDSTKVEFINSMVTKGATYIGHNDLDLGMELSRHVDAYVMYFSDATRLDHKSWEANEVLLCKLLCEPNRKTFIAIVDCDARGMAPEKTQISRFHDGEQVSGDILGQQQFLSDKCLARYAHGSLDIADVKRPVKRRFVKVACPGKHCNHGDVCDWICSKCLAPIEYGFSDEYVYCECGRSLYSNYEFKCKSEFHGPMYRKHEPNVFKSLLKSLETSNYLNVLILGETGVGKSTFINAFVNYVAFNSLDEAKRADELNWVIPCAFSVQNIDRTRSDGQIEQTEIKVGDRSDERDGSKGASATQETRVYPVTIDGSTIRLIDTPGIGDTRGIEYDKKNFADILSTLSSYDELHGIIILLKSNNARLNISFRFCVKELLVHLHKSAAKNMVFGFTNTRISNYMPGDTFMPLNTLLEEHPDVGLSLTHHTTYCFDSESFRYLAAIKNGTHMENEEDFRRSWSHSATEANRLLDHFKQQSPHQVKSTMSLNGARQLIAQLTKPMADISQVIRASIALGEDKVQELSNEKLSGEQLRKRLNFQKRVLKAEQLQYPRTVCTDESCVEYRDDGSGENKVVTVYKTHCHDHCYLTNVKADEIGCAKIINCNAFNGTNNCWKCGHHWRVHLHVTYEIHEHTVTVQDSEIQKQLQDHAEDITLRQTAIKNHEQRIEEYRSEHDTIQKATAQFIIFLKASSITPYNDATITYLEYLIKEEETKVQVGRRGYMRADENEK